MTENEVLQVLLEIKNDIHEILEKMAQFRNEIAGIRELLRPQKCSGADIDLLAKLLPAAGGRFGSSPFRTKDLLTDPGISGLKLGSQQAIGNLFAKAADDAVIVAGLSVERNSKEHGAMLWLIVRRLPA
jgi:hypothetical protein